MYKFHVVKNYAVASSKIRFVLSMRYLQNELIFDIDVRVDASERDHKMFGPKTIARLPEDIRLADEWSTTYRNIMTINY